MHRIIAFHIGTSAFLWERNPRRDKGLGVPLWLGSIPSLYQFSVFSLRGDNEKFTKNNILDPYQ